MLVTDGYKQCGCCGQWYTRESWEALPLLGTQPAGSDETGVFHLELRNCPCGSTLAVEFVIPVTQELVHQA